MVLSKVCHWGCSQGSILNITTDDLEDGLAYISNPGAPEPEIDNDFGRAHADIPDTYLQYGDSPPDDPPPNAPPEDDPLDDTFHSAALSVYETASLVRTTTT